MEARKPGQGDIAFQANLYESANPSRRWLHGVRRAWVMAAIQRYARRRGTRFLEVGIGCGIYTAEMAKLGPVLAIDINPDFVAAVAGLENVEARVDDVTSLSLRPSYDVAVCSEVIEHLPESQTALSNIAGALRPGGVLILTTPHAFSTAELFARLLVFPLVRGLVRKLYAEHVEDLGHINRLTRTALLNQIQNAGFEVLEQHDCGLYLPGVAEFGGTVGRDLARWLEGGLRHLIVVRELLWTQCYVLRKKQASDA
ncbi:MAG: class I SAM-dependent methyltransferase [Uliginosibacterium sp.]|nr:class I SAM-dependent methyltransferase [Uliginosibacterium sp.]MBK9616893.1 class I SAM-dependent methyltransferase [Uliginosibacterium sp.]